MSYPFFRCASCQNRVQQAVGCGGGYSPLVGFMRKGMRFSSLFDEEAEFASHCRGQGIMYNGRTPLQLRDASADDGGGAAAAADAGNGRSIEAMLRDSSSQQTLSSTGLTRPSSFVPCPCASLYPSAPHDGSQKSLIAPN